MISDHRPCPLIGFKMILIVLVIDKANVFRYEYSSSSVMNYEFMTFFLTVTYTIQHTLKKKSSLICDDFNMFLFSDHVRKPSEDCQGPGGCRGRGRVGRPSGDPQGKRVDLRVISVW